MASFPNSSAGRQSVTAAIADAQRFRKLAANLPGVIYTYVLRPNGSDAFTYLSDNLRELYELEPAAVMRNAELLWRCLHSEDLDRLTATVAESAQNLTRWQTEWRIVTPSGQLKWISGIAQPEQQADGTVVWDGIFLDISDRKQVEAELRQTAERLQDAQRIAHLGHWELDAATQAMTWSEEMFRIFGLDPRQGVPSIEAHLAQIYPADREFHRQSLERLLAGKPTDIEFRIRRPKGEVRYLNVRAEPIGDRDGKPLRYVGTTMDITDRKRAEQALHDNAELFRAIFDQAAIGLCYIRRDGHFSRVNAKLCELLGYSEADLLQRAADDLTHPDDLAADRAQFERLNTGEIARFVLEKRYRHAQGSWVWTEVSVSAVRNAKGESRFFIGAIQDISDRRAAEQRARELLAILEAAPDFIGSADRTGRITYLNPRGRELIGLAREADLSNLKLTALHPPASAELLAKTAIPSAIANGFWLGETELRRADGTLLPVSQAIVAHYDEAGAVQYLSTIVRDISAAKQAERQLREQAILLQAVLDSIPQAVFWKDRDGIYRGCNQRFARDAGASHPSELIGRDDFAMPWTAAETEMYREHDRRVLESGQGTLNIEEPITRGDGSQGYLQTSKVPLTNAEGEVVGVLGVYDDITERKATEAVLRDREQFLRSIYDGVEQGIFVADIDADGNYRYQGWNRVIESFFGIPSAAARGRTPAELFPPEQAAYFQAMYQACADSGASHTFEGRIEGGDRTIWSLTTLKLLRDEGDRPYRIVGTTVDISDRRRAELDLQQRAEREALFNQLATQIRNSLDSDTIIETAVRALRDLLDLDRAYVFWYFDAEPEPYWEATKESKRENLPSLSGRYPVSAIGPMSDVALRGQTVRVDEVATYEEPALQQFLAQQGYSSFLVVPLATSSGRQGALVAGHCSGPRPWTEGEVELVEIIASQMAIAINQAELYEQAQIKTRELEQAYRELQQTQAQLIQSEKMSSLGQLVAGVAHEINNPVNFIYGNIAHANDYLHDLLDLLEQYQAAYPEPEAAIAETIEAIDLDFLLSDLPKLFDSMRVGADRIKEIVKSLRTFSRLDEADMKAIDLHESLDSTLMILQNRLKAKTDRPAIEVIKHYGQLPQVDCYAGQLNQVFMNLIGNAIDALEERDKQRSPEELAAHPGRIRIETAVVGDRVRIRIQDNGIGIPADKVNRIFDPFYTTKPVGKGTGLGLSISYQIVTDKHRGRLSCRSELGRGTEFAIEIPQRQPEMT